MAPATRFACARRRSRSPGGSAPSATSSTRSSPRARTRSRGRSATRWRRSPPRAAASSIRSSSRRSSGCSRRIGARRARRSPTQPRPRPDAAAPEPGARGRAGPGIRSSRVAAVPEPDVAAAVARLDELTRRLRRECPWDREQDERSIVPHTVEEAYELADAANAGDDAKLLDELGDVLFQVHFLSLLLEERGAGDMADVAEHCRAKLIRRHPHVFGDAAAETAGEVLRNWDAIKRTEPGREGGIFG